VGKKPRVCRVWPRLGRVCRRASAASESRLADARLDRL